MSELRETEFGIVASDWRFIPSTEYCLKITDGTHDSPKEQKAGKHLITSKHIKGKDVDFENAYLISEEDYNKINERSKVDQWDVIISMIGEYCGFSFVERNKEINYAVKNVGLFKTGNKKKAYWLYYFLNSRIGRFILETNKSGTSQPYLTLGFLRDFPVLYPNTEQEATVIVEILSSLDDKIDLLHRQNKTLEQLAETIFRQWFVEEADESWEVGKLGDVLELIYGKGLKDEIRTGKGFPVIGSNGIVGYHSEYLAEGPGVVIGRKGTLGKVIYLFENFYPIDTTYFVKSKISSIGLFYEYFLLKKLNFGEMNSDSAVPGLNRDIALSTEIRIAPSDKISEFNQQSFKLFEKLNQNNKQIQSLTQLRNTLLPKLMSGEVRIEL